MKKLQILMMITLSTGYMYAGDDSVIIPAIEAMQSIVGLAEQKDPITEKDIKPMLDASIKTGLANTEILNLVDLATAIENGDDASANTIETKEVKKLVTDANSLRDNKALSACFINQQKKFMNEVDERTEKELPLGQLIEKFVMNMLPCLPMIIEEFKNEPSVVEAQPKSEITSPSVDMPTSSYSNFKHPYKFGAQPKSTITPPWMTRSTLSYSNLQ